ncbi:MAG: hypothetical protein U0169_13930 [Polyangiaceae bacterium]
MIVVLALVVALVAVAGSLHRIRLVLTPTAVDVAVLLARLRESRDVRRTTLAELEAFADREPSADWERDVVRALALEGEARAARLGELVGEYGFRLERWVRVPRVLASVSSSACFLLATLLLRRGLTTDIVLDENGIVGVDALVMQAVDVAAMGLAGTAVCVAAQLRARKFARTKAKEVDELMELLEVAAV